MRGRSLLFTIFGDMVVPRGREVWIGSLIRLMQEFGVTPEATRVAVSRMAQQGWLSTRRVGQRSYYALTAKGIRRIESGARRVYTEQQPWDSQWRILAYTIPEENRPLRDQLRRELAWLGFAPLSTGTWITPQPVDRQALDMIEGAQLDDFVELFTARYSGPRDDGALVRRCWNLEDISRRYNEFLVMYQPKLELVRQQLRHGVPVQDSVCFVERTLLVHEFRKFLHVDPGLPQELLQSDWAGSLAQLAFREYYKLLTPGTEAFFHACFEDPTIAKTRAAKTGPTRRPDQGASAPGS